jgi:RecJ-like exonuclease
MKNKILAAHKTMPNKFRHCLNIEFIGNNDDNSVVVEIVELLNENEFRNCIFKIESEYTYCNPCLGTGASFGGDVGGEHVCGTCHGAGKVKIKDKCVECDEQKPNPNFAFCPNCGRKY